MKNSKNRVDTKIVTQIVELRKKYASTKELSERFNIPEDVLRRLFRKHGCNSRKCARYKSPESIKEIIRLYIIDKRSMIKIGKLFNCSAESISSIIKKNGIYSRKAMPKYVINCEELMKDWDHKRNKALGYDPPTNPSK